MQGVQSTHKAILSELEYLIAWSSHSELPVQNPVSNQKGELVTTVIVEDEEVHCSVLQWIFGETMSKQDFNSEETVNTFGTNIANLHRFSLSYQHGSCFIRPEYGIEWTNTMLTKLRLGEEIGIISSGEFHILKNTFSLINARMKEWNKTNDTWGFIHADINYSNLILTSKGISFIDFGLSGFGYYMMDVAMSALMTKGEFRDALLSGYTNIISKRVEIEQLEAFMFLAIVGYYTFILGQKNKHKWIRENIPKRPNCIL